MESALGPGLVIFPAFKQKFLLSDSLLSMVLLAVAAGSIVSMPLVGQAVRYFGSRRCIIVSVACFAFCLVSIALAPSLTLFAATALLFGAAKGGADVGINAQAVVVENCYGRPIMSSFQALWSVGGLAGGFLTDARRGIARRGRWEALSAARQSLALCRHPDLYRLVQ